MSMTAKPPPSEAPTDETEKSEYDKFDALARKLVTVSKRDLDKAREPKTA